MILLNDDLYGMKSCQVVTDIQPANCSACCTSIYTRHQSLHHACKCLHAAMMICVVSCHAMRWLQAIVSAGCNKY